MDDLAQIPAKGFDISHNNFLGNYESVDWGAIAGAGFGFVFVKATDGLTFKDPLFLENANRASAAGISVGAYHFLRPRDDAGLQAQQFMEQIERAGGPGKFPLGAAVDVENPDDEKGAWDPLARAERILKVSHWLEVVDAAFGRRSFIYCVPRWWAEYFGEQGDFSGHPLWVASPGRTPDLSGTTWTDWTIWQDDFNGVVPGIGGGVDLDRSHQATG